MNRRYFQAVHDGDRASIDIYGDITSWPFLESDVSSWTLAKWLKSLPETVSEIEVNINSYGGEVAEGIAIFNTLRAHPAHVTTVCTGFAASIASVIFCAGDERVMNEASLLFVHNASTFASGNAEKMRKAADDLDTVTDLSKRIYLELSDYSEEEITELMDAESWITPEQALEHGLATSLETIAEGGEFSQDARRVAMQAITRDVAQVTIGSDQIGRLLYRILDEKYGEDADEPTPKPQEGASQEPVPEPEPEPEGGPEPEDEEQQQPPEGGSASQEKAFLRLLEIIATD